MTGRARDTGVTLLELLVAVGILGVVSALLYGTFSRSLATRDYAEDRARVFSSGRAAMDWLERDLRGAFSAGQFPRGPGLFVARGLADEETGDRDDPPLELTTVTSLGTLPSLPPALLPENVSNLTDQARIVYRLEEDGDDLDGPDDPAGLALVRYDLRPPTDADLEKASRSVIARGVESLRMRFFDGLVWQDSWDSREQGSQHDAAPAIVETRLVIHARQGEPVELVSGVSLALGGPRGG